MIRAIGNFSVSLVMLISTPLRADEVRFWTEVPEHQSYIPITVEVPERQVVRFDYMYELELVSVVADGEIIPGEIFDVHVEMGPPAFQNVGPGYYTFHVPLNWLYFITESEEEYTPVRYEIPEGTRELIIRYRFRSSKEYEATEYVLRARLWNTGGREG